MSDDTILVLIRHGEAECNVAGVFGGPNTCTGLSERGRSQVEALRDRLLKTEELADSELLYSSVLPRAIETAEIVMPATRASEIRTDCDLCELHPGECDGMSYVDYRTSFWNDHAGKWSDDPTVPASPGGESWAAFIERSTSRLTALADEHDGHKVVVACHGGVIDASMIAFLDLPHAYRPGRFGTSTASMTMWMRRASRWRLLRYNDASHAAGL